MVSVGWAEAATFGTRIGGQIVVTLSVLAASLFVILSRNRGPKDKHWAYAAIGTIVGFWLKG